VSSPIQTKTLKVLIYSDDAQVRSDVRGALGRRPAADLPEIQAIEVATAPAVMSALSEPGSIDLVILDGEAVPSGGMGIARSIKDEIYQAPPVLLIVGRAADSWLATWSRAERWVSHPIDPFSLANAAADLLRH
jgi:DNA-binding response OmpR family regulator